MVRDALHDQEGLRPSFLGHLLVEIFLDAALAEEKPHLLERYYQILEEIEPTLSADRLSTEWPPVRQNIWQS